MAIKVLEELKSVVEEERSALLSGAVDEILKWSTQKIRLLHQLQNRELTPDEKELLREIYEYNEKNRRIIEAGLSFVEEAYRLLSSFVAKGETYNKERVLDKEQLLSRSA